MRRLLSNPPKGIKYEVLGELIRATINTTKCFEPFSSVPYQPAYCPVCGYDAGTDVGHLAVVLALEFINGEKYEFVAWSHKECFNGCLEIDEPDANLE